MNKPIGAYMKEFEDLGVQVLHQGEQFITISVPSRASNGMTSEELASYFSRILNQYITGGRCENGAIQVQHIVREDNPSEGVTSEDRQSSS